LSYGRRAPEFSRGLRMAGDQAGTEILPYRRRGPNSRAACAWRRRARDEIKPYGRRRHPGIGRALAWWRVS